LAEETSKAQDDTIETADSATEDAPTQPSDPKPAYKGVFLPLIFGGAIAAGLGFFAGQLDSVEAWLSPEVPDSIVTSPIVDDIAALNARISQQDNALQGVAAETEALRAEFTALQQTASSSPDGQAVEQSFDAQEVDLSPLTASLEELRRRVGELETTLSTPHDVETQGASQVDLKPLESAIAANTAVAQEMQQAMQAIADRLTLVEETQAQAISVEQLDAYKAELLSLQAVIGDQSVSVAAMLERTEAAEQAALEREQLSQARAVMLDLTAAVADGRPFSDEVADLTRHSEMSVPEPLTQWASSGVAALSELQAEFPQAARAALAADRSSATGDGGGGLGGFLQRRLGARSVTPQEGSGSNAILSRAEAHIKAADLSSALQELEALPDSAKSAMADWLVAAQARASVLSAIDDVSTGFGSN